MCDCQYQMATDEITLIQQAATGNLDAFNDLILRYQDQVYNVAYRIMGSHPPAEDATQDALITAFRRLETYRGGSFKSWLLRITTNTCYDALRYDKRRPATAFDDMPGGESDDGPPIAAATETPEQAAQRAELNRAIQECIVALQADQRLALVMCDIEGYSYQEIADTAGVSLGTVKSRISRARKAVRDCLQAVRELLPAVYRQQDNDV
jgi:RNA polymerase sigma-70 factor (ECF subfamily)